MAQGQRGSLGAYIDEPEHEKVLGWALFGLPLLVAGFGLAAWLTRRRVLARSWWPRRSTS